MKKDDVRKRLAALLVSGLDQSSRVVEINGPFLERAIKRYLLRRDILAGTWMVWDRLQRGPATRNDRKLIRLSREEADVEVARLIGRGDRDAPEPSAWEIRHGGLTIECRDEHDAKKVAGGLYRRGHRVSARRCNPTRSIEPNQMRGWLSEKLPTRVKHKAGTGSRECSPF
jgi:hypothetical protein